MEIKVNNRIIKIKQEEIENLMNTLNLTEQEAIDTWLFDNGYEESEEVEKLTKKAKENKTDKIVVTTEKKKQKRERKAPQNPLKQAIIDNIFQFLAKNSTIYGLKVENPTKTIDFYAEDKYFSLNLVEHRPKKDKN